MRRRRYPTAELIANAPARQRLRQRFNHIDDSNAVLEQARANILWRHLFSFLAHLKFAVCHLKLFYVFAQISYCTVKVVVLLVAVCEL
jgi:hypothetical protein